LQVRPQDSPKAACLRTLGRMTRRPTKIINPVFLTKHTHLQPQIAARYSTKISENYIQGKGAFRKKILVRATLLTDTSLHQWGIESVLGRSEPSPPWSKTTHVNSRGAAREKWRENL
jgi:hypothetical protein